MAPTSWGNFPRFGSNARAARRFRDRLMTATDSCESLWTTSITAPADDPGSLGVMFPTPSRQGCRWRRARAFAPSKIEAVIPRQILQRGLGPSAEMLDHLGSGERSKPCSRAIVHAARQSDQKTCGEEIARASGVDQPLDRARWNGVGLLAGHNQTSFFAAGDHGKPHVVAQRLDRGVEVGGLIETVQLALIGEDDINRAGANEIEEFRAISADAKRVRQCERDIALGAVRDLCGLEEGFLRVRRIPQIALEIDDL